MRNCQPEGGSIAQRVPRMFRVFPKPLGGMISDKGHPRSHVAGTPAGPEQA